MHLFELKIYNVNSYISNVPHRYRVYCKKKSIAFCYIAFFVKQGIFKECAMNLQCNNQKGKEHKEGKI